MKINNLIYCVVILSPAAETQEEPQFRDTVFITLSVFNFLILYYFFIKLNEYLWCILLSLYL